MTDYAAFQSTETPAMEELRRAVERGGMEPRSITVMALGTNVYIHPHETRRPAVTHESSLAVGYSD